MEAEYCKICSNENKILYFSFIEFNQITYYFRTAGNMCFSTFLQDATMFRANFIGFSIFAVYISIYFYYVDSKDKIKALRKIIIAIAIVVAMFGYTKYEDPNLVAKRFGIFLTALLYCLIATPLLHTP